jgi:uncharacterized membrane protein YphA (DoxX/SURF4 family)
MEWLKSFGMLIGRILLILIFLESGIGKIGNLEGTAKYMAQFGMSSINFSSVPSSLNWWAVSPSSLVFLPGLEPSSFSSF